MLDCKKNNLTEIEIYYKAVSLINAACHIKKQKLHERKGERNYERNYE